MRTRSLVSPLDGCNIGRSTRDANQILAYVHCLFVFRDTAEVTPGEVRSLVLAREVPERKVRSSFALAWQIHETVVTSIVARTIDILLATPQHLENRLLLTNKCG